MATIEEYKRRIKSEQSSKSYLRRERDHYRQLYNDVMVENIALRAKIEDESQRGWSPTWLKQKLVEAQMKNERLKKYIIELEEGKTHE